MKKKKREKRLVRIDALEEFQGNRIVHFKFRVGQIPYQGSVTVGLTEDPWPKIREYLDSEHAALLQQEREV